MYTVHDEYDLKRSRIAIVFQILFLAVIALVLFLLMSLWLFILSLMMMLWVFYLFHRQPKLQKIAQLDQDKWSLKFQNNSKIETVQFYKIIEHYFYVVLYFKTNVEENSDHKKLKSVLVWKDQVDEKSWKRLLIRANL